MSSNGKARAIGRVLCRKPAEFRSRKRAAVPPGPPPHHAADPGLTSVRRSNIRGLAFGPWAPGAAARPRRILLRTDVGNRVVIHNTDRRRKDIERNARRDIVFEITPRPPFNPLRSFVTDGSIIANSTLARLALALVSITSLDAFRTIGTNRPLDPFRSIVSVRTVSALASAIAAIISLDPNRAIVSIPPVLPLMVLLLSLLLAGLVVTVAVETVIVHVIAIVVVVPTRALFFEPRAGFSEHTKIVVREL